MRFDQKEIQFIRDILHVNVREEENDGEVLDEIWEAAAEIETAESNRYEVLSEHGQMAVSLITKIGNDSE